MPARVARGRAIRNRTWNDQHYVPSTHGSFNATYHQFDLWLPSVGNPPYPLVIFCHGGGWHSGTKNIGANHYTRGVLAEGIALASIGYPVSTEGAWPGHIYAVKAAIRFLRANAAKYLLDPARMAGWGYSAGAHLLVLSACSPGVSVLRDASMGNGSTSEALAACVGYSTPVYFPDEDAQLVTNGFAARCCGTTSEEARLLGGDPNTGAVNPCSGAGLTLSAEASAQTYIASGGAPLRLEHGTIDPTVPYQQSLNLAALGNTRGVACTYLQHAGANHDFTGDTAIVAATIAWLKLQLGV